MNNPLFSIIIPTYNRADFLKIAIESVLNQTCDDFELIIIDDGSTDHTRETVETCITSPGHQVTRTPETNNARRTTHDDFSVIRYVYQENQGPAAARNRGIEISRGEYICFLDSDDRFRSTKLEVTATFIRRYRAARIFHTQELWYRNGKMIPHKKHHRKPEGRVLENALKLCCISLSTACIHRDVFKEIGAFDETMAACEDYDFWLRVTSRYPVKLIDACLTIKEGGNPDQQSKRYPAMDTFRLYAIEKLIVNDTLSPVALTAAIEEYRNKCSIYINGAAKRGKHDEVKTYQEKLKKFDQLRTTNDKL